MTTFYHKSGILKFKYPYLNTNRIADSETRVITMDYCNVEIHITEKEFNKNRLVTVYLIEAKESLSVTNLVEHIATDIRNSYISKMFTNYNEVSNKLTNGIKWIQVDYFPKLDYQEVEMAWDDKKQSYHSPSWKFVEGVELEHLEKNKDKY